MTVVGLNFTKFVAEKKKLRLVPDPKQVEDAAG